MRCEALLDPILSLNEIRELIDMKPVDHNSVFLNEYFSSKKILPKNCTRCGAPTDSRRNKCEYCGCEY